MSGTVIENAARVTENTADFAAPMARAAVSIWTNDPDRGHDIGMREARPEPIVLGINPYTMV